MARFTSLRRVMGGFMPPDVDPVMVRDEGMAEALRHVDVLGRFLIRQLTRLEKQMANQATTTQDILDAVRAQRTQIASLSTLLGGIRQRLTDALAGQLSPEAQKILDDTLAEIHGNSTAIADAIATNDDDPSTIASDGSGGPVAASGTTAPAAPAAPTGSGMSEPAPQGDTPSEPNPAPVTGTVDGTAQPTEPTGQPVDGQPAA
jgi:uncharacterized coiled-coil protein SlyX